MRDLKPLYRQMVEMRRQGYSMQEIADGTQRSERLVRRVLDQFKDQLQQRYREYTDG
jgi:hypothetical protein